MRFTIFDPARDKPEQECCLRLIVVDGRPHLVEVDPYTGETITAGMILEIEPEGIRRFKFYGGKLPATGDGQVKDLG